MKTISRLAIVVFSIFNFDVTAQTLFETAKDDGVIQFTKGKTSQIKINLTSSAITYGFNYSTGNATSKLKFLVNADFKAKPNDDGVSAFVKTGTLQPGAALSSSVGVRLNNMTGGVFTVFDFFVKPTYDVASLTIYDPVRGATGLDPVYKTTKNSFGVNGVFNAVLSPGPVNLFLGFQYGHNWTNNSGNLDDATVQTVQPYANTTTKTLATDVKAVKYGQLLDARKKPLKFDLIFDPQLKLATIDSTSNINLGFFGYYRTDGEKKKYRKGVGICLLDRKNPCKVFSSLGYEFPVTGSDVKEIDRQKDNGIVFLSVGYSIFK